MTCPITLLLPVSHHVALVLERCSVSFFFFQAEDGIRDFHVTGVQTCALPIYPVLAGMTAERTIRASPVRFSVSTGLRLWGIAEEPFWPGEKYSSASRTSVRCRCLISIARFSMEEAITARVAKKAA